MKKLILMATALSMAGSSFFPAIVSKNKSNITDIFRAGQGEKYIKRYSNWYNKYRYTKIKKISRIVI